MEDSKAQMAKSSLDKTMEELRRGQAENEILMADMDYSQVGLPKFYVQNDMSQPSQEEMSNLEVAIAKLRRVQVESATYQALFIEEVHIPPQEESNFKSKVDELAITMANWAKCRAELFIEETRTNVQI